MRRFVAILAVSVLVFAGVSSGHLFGPPANLEKLIEEADLIFKATAASSLIVQDDWFQQDSNYVVRETLFKVVSVIKGDPQSLTVRFRHYDMSDRQLGGSFFPQYYHFQEKREYIVFAKRGENPAVYRQLWMRKTGGTLDQGALPCIDEKPVATGTVKEILWTEFMALLQSSNSTDTLFAIRQLNQMSDHPGQFDATEDFDRTDVLKVVGPLMTHRDHEIAQAAITVIGSANPYLEDDRAPWWLGTVGVDNPGLSKMDAKMKNPGGELYRKDLISIASGKAATSTRALAIRALGLVRNPELLEPLHRWLKDPEPAVRASATLLVADFPNDSAMKTLTTMSADPAPEVRRCAAHAIGFMQQVGQAVTLGELLLDKDVKVRSAACMSLLSFSPKHEVIGKMFVANLKNEEFSPLFLLPLAREKPEAYLETLAQAVEQQTEPRNGSNGQIPAFTAFNILFKFLQSQPADTVRAGKFDRYLDAIEKGYVTGSSEPRDIYAFYLQRGMTERAKIYRTRVTKEDRYNLDYFFNMVDQSPSTYTR